MTQELTFTRYAELLLARVAEAERDRGASVFLDVHELMDDLAPVVEEQWAFQAAKLLEGRDLVDGIFTLGGTAQVMLTAEGRVFVEGENSDVIRDYRNSSQVVFVWGDGNQVAVGHGQTAHQSGSFSSEEVLELLDEAEERLRASDLPDAERDDALADVETAKVQLKKQKPNLAIVKTTVEALRGVNTVADLGDRLHGLLT